MERNLGSHGQIGTVATILGDIDLDGFEVESFRVLSEKSSRLMPF